MTYAETKQRLIDLQTELEGADAQFRTLDQRRGELQREIDALKASLFNSFAVQLTTADSFEAAGRAMDAAVASDAPPDQ